MPLFADCLTVYLQEELQRMREAEYFKEWEQQEDSVSQKSGVGLFVCLFVCLFVFNEILFFSSCLVYVNSKSRLIVAAIHLG